MNKLSAAFRRWLQEGSSRLDDEMTGEWEDTPLSSPREPKVPGRPAGPSGSPEASGSSRPGRWLRRLSVILSVLLCLGIISALVITAGYLPSFGRADNPANNEVYRRYVENGREETGAVNMVAGMILDYRAFDTLGESNVLFTALCAVMLLLRVTDDRRNSAARQLELETDDRMYEPKNDPVLRRVSRLIIPCVMMLGIYIILNGHLSPGGGFSGGAVMGAGMILMLNAYGFRRMERFFTIRLFRAVTAAALSFYALSKAYSFFVGANGLHSFISPGIPGRLFSAGLIPWLNIAVGMVVCCTVYALYALFRKGDL